nr:MAG TPA: regulatory protein [Caudoviricetes sp.]
MENLVEIKKNQVITSSRQVAECFGKEHKNVLRDIKEILAAQNSATRFFYETTFENRGKQYPMYLMNRDGFSLLVMGFTGREALQWKIKYIEAFNDMEKYLKQLQVSNVDKKILDCKYDEVQMEKSKLWLELADKVDIKEYKQMAKSYAFNTLAGSNVLPLPEVKELTYSATEVGEIFGVSKNKIGSLANKHNLKTDEYGKYFYDKSRYSNKEVQTFRYNRKAIEVFKSLLGGAKE